MRAIKARTFLLLIFLSLSPFSQPHVVFEEIGLMAGSVSYMHCALTLDLGLIEDMVTNGTLAARSYATFIDRIYSTNPTLTDQQIRDKTNYLRISAEFEDWLDDLRIQINHLRETLPSPTPDRVKRAPLLGGLMVKAATLMGKTVLRKVKFPQLSFSIANGIFGTFMGLYSTRQLEKLRTELGDVHNQQDRLVVIVSEHQEAIVKLANDTANLQSTITTLTLVNPPYIVAKLSRMIDRIRTAIHTAIHVIQQAQHRRLAFDYLPPAQLKELFQELELAAKQLHYVLIPKIATDLFQLEISYLHDGRNVIILLHVPMVPDKSLMRLFRLRPFPIPFSPSRALLPTPSTAVLALSQTSPRTMTLVELVDLLDCHQVNSVFLCERHGILHRDVRAFCLGALFEQDIETAKVVCDLELVPYKEYVLQLQSNWFLVYSPKLYTAHVRCYNGTHSEIHIKPGVNKFFVSPSCFVDLINITLVSDLSMKLDSAIKHFSWESTDMSQFGIQDSDIDQALRELDGIAADQELLLSEVLAHQRMDAKIPSRRLILVLVGSIGSIGIIVAIIMLFSTHRFVKIRNKLRRVRQVLENALPTHRRNLDRPEPPPQGFADLPPDVRELLERHQ